MTKLRRAYEREVLARLLDHGMSSVDGLRAELLAPLAGRVIEVGFGSGSNLPFYGPAVTELVAIEPAEGLADVARARLARWGRPGSLEIASAMRPLPVDRGSFDVAVLTFVLCSVPDVATVLGHVRDTVRAGGTIVLAEHVIGETRARRAVQRALAPAWSIALGGCDPARDTLREIARTGLDVRALEPRALSLPYPIASGLVGPIRVGDTHPPSNPA